MMREHCNGSCVHVGCAPTAHTVSLFLFKMKQVGFKNQILPKALPRHSLFPLLQKSTLKHTKSCTCPNTGVCNKGMRKSCSRTDCSPPGGNSVLRTCLSCGINDHLEAAVPVSLSGPVSMLPWSSGTQCPLNTDRKSFVRQDIDYSVTGAVRPFNKWLKGPRRGNIKRGSLADEKLQGSIGIKTQTRSSSFPSSLVSLAVMLRPLHTSAGHMLNVPHFTPLLLSGTSVRNVQTFPNDQGSRYLSDQHSHDPDSPRKHLRFLSYTSRVA